MVKVFLKIARVRSTEQSVCNHSFLQQEQPDFMRIIHAHEYLRENRTDSLQGLYLFAIMTHSNKENMCII